MFRVRYRFQKFSSSKNLNMRTYSLYCQVLTFRSSIGLLYVNLLLKKLFFLPQFLRKIQNAEYFAKTASFSLSRRFMCI